MKFFLIFLFIFSLNCFPATYYVSPKGSNSNDGSLNHPFATPGYASKQLSPGDTLIIMPGDYILSVFDDDIITPPSGTENAWTIIKGQYANNKPRLLGRNNLLSAIDIGGKSYIRIENLEISNYNSENFREGIESWQPCSNIILKNLYIHHIDEMGINIRDANNVTMENLIVEFCGFGGAGGPTGENGGWQNVHIINSEFSFSGHYYQGTSGPSPYDRPDGLGTEPSNGPLIVENCIFSHNKGDGFDSKCENTEIKNSIIANNSCDGLKLWGDNSKAVNCLVYGRGDGDLSQTPWGSIVVDTPQNASISFINCTVWQNPLLSGYPMYVQYGESGNVSLKMVNCIISGGESEIYFGENVNLEFHHNLINISGSVKVRCRGNSYNESNISELGDEILLTTPKFKNPKDGDNADFHLTKQSTAIDRGTNGEEIPKNDLDDNSRPQGKGIDIGCYEYSETFFIPHIAYRNYTTYLIVYNTKDSFSNYTLTLFNSLGQKVLSHNYEVSMFNTKKINLTDLGKDIDGKCGIIKGDSNTVFKLAYFNTDGGMAEFIISNEKTKKGIFLFPSYNKQITWNGIAIFNTENESTTVNLSAFYNGEEIATQIITIPPHANIVDTVGNNSSILPNLDIDNLDFILITSTKSICGLNISGENQEKLVFSPVTPLN